MSRTPGLVLAVLGATACGRTTLIGPGATTQTQCSGACLQFPLGTFVDVGGPVNTANVLNVDGQDVRIASNGYPAVLFDEIINSTSYVLYAQWDGSVWNGLADSATTGIDAGAGAFGSLHFNSLDQPSAGYLGPSNGIYFRHYDGTAWSELAGSATSPGIATGTEPAMILDGSDAPVIAWTNGGSVSDIYVRRFDGSSWQELASSASGGGVSNTAATSSTNGHIATAANGDLYVAWQEAAAGAPCVYLKRYDGSSWSEVGGSASNAGISGSVGFAEDVRVTVDSSGQPIVAWSHDTSSVTEIYLRRFDGTAWQELGGSASGGGISAMGLTSTIGALSLDASDNPVVSWTTNLGAAQRAYLRRWDGSTWAELDGSASGDGIGLAQIGNDVEVRHDTRGNELCVMWTHGDSQSFPTVRVKCMRMP